MTLPDHIREKFERHFDRIPKELIGPDGPLWNIIYAKVGIADVADLKNALVALLVMDFEFAITFHRAVAQMALGADIDPRHLDVFQEPPINESSWMGAENACFSCPGSDRYGQDYTYPLAGQRLCGSEDRLECWSNCMRFRENALAADVKQGE